MANGLIWSDGTGGGVDGPARRLVPGHQQALVSEPFDPYARVQGAFFGPGGAVGLGLREPFGAIGPVYSGPRDLLLEAAGSAWGRAAGSVAASGEELPWGPGQIPPRRAGCGGR